MTEQERIELNLAAVEIQAALAGVRNHNLAAKREREMVNAGYVTALGQGLARIETLLRAPAEQKPKTYRSMKG